MPGARDDQESGVSQRLGKALAESRELGVALAREDHRGHPQLTEAVPQRRHRAGPDPAQRGGEVAAVVAGAVGAGLLGHIGGLAREERLAAPRLDALGLQAPRLALVGGAALRALV